MWSCTFLDEHGVPTFQALQHRSVSRSAVVYYAFDLLNQGRTDLKSRPLAARREALHRLSFAAPILLSMPLPGTPTQIEKTIREAGLEGVVAKRVDSLYEPGRRNTAWVKVKFSRRQEFVIGGYKPAGRNFDSVLVGLYDPSTSSGSSRALSRGEGRPFLCAGKVRAGLTPHTRAEVWQRIAPLRTAECPFANLPNSTGKSHWGEGITAEDMRTLHWVKPRVVVEVAFTEFTASGNLRHASFVALRDDKKASDVRRS